MNCYDFDKTIYIKDSSVRFYLYIVKNKFIRMIPHLIKVVFLFILKALHVISIKKFKEQFFSFLKKIKNIDGFLEDFWNKEIKNMNVWYLKQMQDDDVIISASPKFLLEIAINKINKNATLIATQMDKFTGKISGKNLKGEEKVIELQKHNITTFKGCYTDSLSDFPILDMAKEKYIVCGDNVYEFGKQKPTFFVKINYFFKLLRVHHYIKNGLIMLPLFFGGKLLDLPSIITGLWAFISFCFLSSFVYIINDLLDAKKDRKHTTKRKRPIASYMVKPLEAIILSALLLSFSIGINIYAINSSILSFSLIVTYVILNILYSFILKKFPIIDVYTLSFFYLLRLLYGGSVLGVGISKWLYLTVLCASLYIGLGKRRNEIKQEKSETRSVNKFYSYNFLDKNMYACMVLSMAFYSLWAIDIKSLDSSLLNGIILMATIPIMYFILMRYSLSLENENSSGNPIEILFKDKILIISIAIYILLMTISIYLPINNFQI